MQYWFLISKVYLIIDHFNSYKIHFHSFFIHSFWTIFFMVTILPVFDTFSFNSLRTFLYSAYSIIMYIWYRLPFLRIILMLLCISTCFSTVFFSFFYFIIYLISSCVISCIFFPFSAFSSSGDSSIFFLPLFLLFLFLAWIVYLSSSLSAIYISASISLSVSHSFTHFSSFFSLHFFFYFLLYFLFSLTFTLTSLIFF